MECTEIAPAVYQLKLVDFSFRKMHTFSTPSGTSFNSYLVLDSDATALIDTVPREHATEFVKLLSSKLESRKLTYLIINHAEPDAAGSVRAVLEAYPEVQCICTRKCVEVLELLAIVDEQFTNYQIADLKFSLQLGEYVLRFVPTPLLHWEEQMCCYIEKLQVYFTSDLYGENYAATEIFADQVDKAILQQEGKAYLCEVFGSLQAQIKKAYEITALAKLLCPQHGLILRDENLVYFRQYYENFHMNEHLSNKVSIIYYSMYGSTAKMAQLIADGVRIAGAESIILDLNQASSTDCIVQAFESRAVCIGSPTLNFGSMPEVTEVLAQFEASEVLNEKKAVIFGAFGWSAGSAKEIGDMLKGCGCTVFKEVTWRLNADDKEMDAIRLAGKELCESLQE